MNSFIIYLRNHFDNYEEALDCRLCNRHSYRVKYPNSMNEYRLQEKLFTEILHQTSLPYVEYDVTQKSIEEISKDLETIISNML